MQNVTVTVNEALDNVIITVDETTDTVLVSVREGTLTISDLSDTDITSPVTGEGILYNEVTGKWENAVLSGAGDMLAAVYDPIINANTAKVTDANYVHNQPLPSASWTITHNLNKYPSVRIIDTSGNEVETEITYIDLNNIQSNSSASFAGDAYLN